MHSDRPRALRGTAAALTAAAVGVVLALTGSSAARADSATVGIGATTDFANGYQRLPVAETLYAAGASGFLHQRTGSSDMLWTRYDTGATVTAFTLPSGEPALEHRREAAGWYGLGSDVVALHDYNKPDQVTLYDMANDGATTVVPLGGLLYDGVYGGSVIAVGTDVHLLTPDGAGGVKDLVVSGLPAHTSGSAGVLTGDGTSVVLQYRDAVGNHQAVVDLATGVATPVQLAAPSVAVNAYEVAVSPTSITYWALGYPSGRIFSRADLTAAPTTVSGSRFGGFSGALGVASVGDSVLTIGLTESDSVDGGALTATPQAGGTGSTLLSGTDDQMLQTPDGGALVAGDAPGDSDGSGWGFYRIKGGTSGPVATKAVSMVHPNLPVSAIALERGTVTVENQNKVWSRNVSGGTVSAAVTVENDASGGPMQATGDNHVAFTATNDTIVKAGPSGTTGWLYGGGVASADGRFVLSGGGTLAGDLQYDESVGSLLAPTASGPASGAVWHGFAFVSSGQQGQVTVVDLAAQRVAGSLNSGASCSGADTQVVGRWLYWACDSHTAGVYDLADGVRFSLPATGSGYDDALLGNGYLVHHDATAGQLVLDDIHADAAGASADVLALGGGTAAKDRGVTWTVDRYSPELSWIDTANQFHVASVLGVPTIPDWTFGYKAPAAPAWLTWLSFWHGQDPSGAKYCTGVRISPTRVLTTADCETGHSSVDFGIEQGGGSSNPPYLVDRRYVPATGQDDLSVSRSYLGSGSAVPLAGAADGALYRPGATAVFYSYAGLGTSHEVMTPHAETVQLQSPSACAQLLGHALPAGSLCTTPAAGTFATQLSQCLGDAGGGLIAGGKLIALSATPVGACAASGVRLYTAIAPKIALVRGWSRDIGPYNSYLSFGGVVVNPTPRNGDIGDFCGADMHGCFNGGSGRLVDFSGLYNLILPAGDLNGDGQVDLLLRSKSGGLYRFWGYDRGDGNLDGGKKTYLGSGWNGYTRLFVPGDLTGDGLADLVAIDRAGVMWIYPGTATGTFANRIRVGAGWNGYNLVGGRGDLTGDGLADLIARDSAGRLWTYVGNGHAAFSARVYDGSGWGKYNAIVPGGDLDGQGYQQLIARLPNGYSYLYTATVDGRFHLTHAVGGNGWERYAQLT